MEVKIEIKYPKMPSNAEGFGKARFVKMPDRFSSLFPYLMKR